MNIIISSLKTIACLAFIAVICMVLMNIMNISFMKLMGNVAWIIVPSVIFTLFPSLFHYGKLVLGIGFIVLLFMGGMKII